MIAVAFERFLGVRDIVSPSEANNLLKSVRNRIKNHLKTLKMSPPPSTSVHLQIGPIKSRAWLMISCSTQFPKRPNKMLIENIVHYPKPTISCQKPVRTDSLNNTRPSKSIQGRKINKAANKQKNSFFHRPR